MTTTENRELLRDALPALKALRYRTTISVPPDPSRSLGDGLSDEAVTLLEKLDGKSYYIVDPEGSSGAAATELFEAGLLDLQISRGNAYYATNDLACREAKRIVSWNRVSPGVLEEAKGYLVRAYNSTAYATCKGLQIIKVPEGPARQFMIDRGYVEIIPITIVPLHDRWLVKGDSVAVTEIGHQVGMHWDCEARS